MGDLTERESQPRTINIWLERLNSSRISAEAEPESVRTAKAQKDEAIIVLLAKLAIVYWRPNFTPGQVKQLYSQYLDDLREFAFIDIAEAIEKWRRSGEVFYPLPGQLRSLITTPYKWDPSPRNHVRERLEAAAMELAAVSNSQRLSAPGSPEKLDI